MRADREQSGRSLRLQHLIRLNPCFWVALAIAALMVFVGPPRRPENVVSTELMSEVRGKVQGPPQAGQSGSCFQVRPEEVVQGRSLEYPGSILVCVNGTLAKDETALEVGERVSFTTVLRDPAHFAIPGVADGRQTWWLRGVLHVAHLKSWRQLQREGTTRDALSAVYWGYRTGFLEYCLREFTPATNTLIRSIFLGERSALEMEDREAVSELGLMHLFVVSGLHVGWVLALLDGLVRRLGSRFWLLPVAGMWGYVVLTGGAIPAQRAGLMATALYLGSQPGLRIPILNNLGLSALITFGSFPGSIFTASFQYSYLALVWIGLAFLPLQDRLDSVARGIRKAFSSDVDCELEESGRLERRVRFWVEEHLEWSRRGPVWILGWIAQGIRWLGGVALMAMILQLGLLPLTLFYSNQVVPLQIAWNCLLVPLVGLFFPLCLVLFMTWWASGLLVFSLLTEVTARVCWSLLQRLESVNQVFFLPQPSMLLMIIVLGLLWLSASVGKLRWWPALTLMFVIGVTIPSFRKSDELVVTLLDVGQGDAIHVQYPGGENSLVDTGGFRPQPGMSPDFVGRRLVGRYLWHLGTRGLDSIALTHPHADHIQAADFLSRAFDVGSFWVPDDPEAWWPEPARVLRLGDVFRVAGVQHEVLHPPPDFFPSRSSSNNRSLVLLLSYGDFSMLLTGDVEEEAERLLLERIRPVTVLKVAHHGGERSSTSRFIQGLQPRLAVVSAGRRNPFGHPSAVTLERFREERVPVYSTSRWGTIRIRSDGKTWSVSYYESLTAGFRELTRGGSNLGKVEDPSITETPSDIDGDG